MKNLIFVFSFLVFFTSYSCKRDAILDEGNIVEDSQNSISFTIDEAKNYYKTISTMQPLLSERSGDTNGSTYDLAWKLGKFPSSYNGGLLLVPLKNKELIQQKYVDAYMAFFKDCDNNLDNRLMIFAIDSAYYGNTPSNCNISNFSGVVFQVNNNGGTGLFCKFQNGLLVNYADTLSATGIGMLLPNVVENRGEPKCFNNWGNSFWDEIGGWAGGIANAIGNFFVGIGNFFSGGNGNVGGNIGGFGGFGFGFGGSEGGGTTGVGGGFGDGSSGGGSSTGSGVTLSTFFSELEIKQLNKATDRLNEYFNFNNTISEYLNIIDADCLEDIALLPENAWIDGLENLECLDLEAIGEIPCIGLAENFIADYDLGLTVGELEVITGDFYGWCSTQNVFNEFAAQKLAENMTTCLQYDFVGCNESPNGICPETFKFVSTGDGYTCEVNTINFKYFGAINKNMHIGTLCIQTSKRDIEGKFITPYTASALMAGAYNLAQDMTENEFVLTNHTLTSQQFKELIIVNLNLSMNLVFQNTGMSISISNGPCIGNIPKSKPKYSFLCF